MHLFVLDLADLLDLVVVDVELLPIEVLVVELVLGILGIFWLFVADKGVNCFLILFEEPDALDFTCPLKVGSKLLFGCVCREVLHI